MAFFRLEVCRLGGCILCLALAAGQGVAACAEEIQTASGLAAAGHYAEAQAIYARSIPECRSRPESTRDLVTGFNKLARLYLAHGKTSEAEQTYGQALAWDQGGPPAGSLTGVTLANLASWRGRFTFATASDTLLLSGSAGL